MNKPLFDIDKPSLQAELDSYVPGTGMAWQRLFPLKYTPKFDIESLVADEGLPVTADRVAFNVKAPKKTRKTIGRWSGKLAKISISRERNELEINDYNDYRTIAASATADADIKQHIVDMVYDDVKFCNDGMDARVELDAMRIASHGVQTFPAAIEGENATQDIINFNVPKENFKGASAAWDDVENADGIKDIIDLQKRIKKSGYTAPRFAIMEQEAFEKLTAQKKTLTRLAAFSAYTNSNVVLTADQIDIASVNNYMSRKGYPTIVVIDTYVAIEKRDGSEPETVKPFAENNIVLSPSIQLGWTYYKGVPDVQNTDAVQAHSQYYKTTRYSEVNPMLEVTMAEAYVQCGLINRASLGFINTARTSWNDGEA